MSVGVRFARETRPEGDNNDHDDVDDDDGDDDDVDHDVGDDDNGDDDRFVSKDTFWKLIRLHP